MTENKNKKIKKSTMAMIILTVLMIILNAVSWLSASLSDFYMSRIFQPLSGILSAITGIVPVSLGEIMIIIGIMLLIAIPVLSIIFAVKKKNSHLKKLSIFCCWVLIFILASETLNCFVLYHTTEFSEKYHGGAGIEGFTSQQLTDMCKEIINEANALALEVKRDSDGKMIVPDDLTKLAEISMNRISEDYPELSGNYPQPKKIACSMLMTQLDLQGVYFPFSLEANYNRELSPARVPCTVMHELSHLKGFIREDEASFIAYRACLASDVPEIRYSGCLSAINYLLKAAYASGNSAELSGMISQQVREDNIFVSEEFKEEIEEKAVISTEAVSAFSEKAMETTLKLNGVSDGKKSYGRMVNLLLEYHYYIENE